MIPSGHGNSCYASAANRSRLTDMSLVLPDNPSLFYLPFTKTPSLFFFGFLVAYSASLTRRHFGDYPKVCDLKDPMSLTAQIPKTQHNGKVSTNMYWIICASFHSLQPISYWFDPTIFTHDLLKRAGDGCPEVPAGNCPHVEKDE